MIGLAHRIIAVLKEGGPRKPNVLRGMKGATTAVFERAVGQLFLGGFVLWRGKTSGRRLAINGRRSQEGIAQVQLALYMGAFVLICAAAWGLHTWWVDYEESLREEGRNEERVKWQAKQQKDQAVFDAKLAKLESEKNAALAQLQDDLTNAQANFEKKRLEADRAKAESDKYRRDIAAGRIVFVDPGMRPRPPDGGVGSPPGPGAVAGGDAKAGCGAGRLSSVTAEFLWSEAGRADGTIRDLLDQINLLQDNVTAYYTMAKNGCKGNAANQPQ